MWTKRNGLWNRLFNWRCPRLVVFPLHLLYFGLMGLIPSLNFYSSTLPPRTFHSQRSVLFHVCFVCYDSGNGRTAQLLDVKTGGRRYVDTGVLISEFSGYPFTSERHVRAIARMNWIHEQYRISNDDKLYTLSVFVTSPARWLEKYDWRPLTELETAVPPPSSHPPTRLSCGVVFAGLMVGMVDYVAGNRPRNENTTHPRNIRTNPRLGQFL